MRSIEDINLNLNDLIFQNNNLLLVELAYSNSKIAGPYKIYGGAVIKYYFKSDVNNKTYSVNFIRLEDDSYILNFYPVVEEEELKQKENINKLNIYKKEIDSEFKDLDKKDSLLIMAYIFNIIKKFLIKFKAKSLWIELNLSDGDLSSDIKPLKIQFSKKEPKNLFNRFEKTKTGLLYKKLVSKAISGTDYKSTYDKTMMVIYNPSSYNETDGESDVLTTKPDLVNVTKKIIKIIKNIKNDNKLKTIQENITYLVKKIIQ